MRRMRIASTVCVASLLLATGLATAQGASTSVETQGSRLSAERVEVPLRSALTIVNSERADLERGFLGISVPDVLDSVYLDVAELILMVSTVYDTTEPLIIVAAPVTSTSASQTLASSSDWKDQTSGFDSEYMSIVPMNSTEDMVEIRIDVTHLVRRWLTGEAPNYGVVLKSLSENKSTFSWIRDGRYEGADAKLVVLYSRL